MERTLRMMIPFACLCLAGLIPSCAVKGNGTDKGNAVTTYDKKAALADKGSSAMRRMDGMTLVQEMRIGWNLGNTLDATGGRGLSSETSWGVPLTTREMMHGIAATGIRTVRIPVSWHNHIIDSDYTIDPAWMSRVKEVVDMAIAEGLYVILNTHHDNASSDSMKRGEGYYPAIKAQDESERFMANVWAQIALAFNGSYDEHLVFELMNEPRLVGTQNEWWFDSNSSDCTEAASLINVYEQIALDAIRRSGGNNAERFVMVPAYAASPDGALSDEFRLPRDSASGKLVLSVHAYSPYSFAMDEKGERTFMGRHEAELDSLFYSLYAKFVDKGIPVVIGETGATNKDNLRDREKWFSYYFGKAKSYGMTSCLWDNQYWEIEGTSYSEHFGYYDRSSATWQFPTLIQAALDAVAAYD